MRRAIRDAFDRWAVVWWPRAASDQALAARYDALVLALRDGDLGALADIGPVARELRRRGIDTPREPR